MQTRAPSAAHSCVGTLGTPLGARGIFKLEPASSDVAVWHVRGASPRDSFERSPS